MTGTSRSRPPSPRARLLPWAILLGVSLVLAAGFYAMFDGVFWPITNPACYARLAARWRDVKTDDVPHAGLLDAFPTSLPATATGTRLFYWSPPGDEDLQVRFHLPPADLAELVRRVTPLAKVIAKGSDEMDYKKELGELPVPLFYVGDTPSAWRLPESYTLYELGVAHQLSGTPSDRLVHMSGVAIDPAQNDVIFWVSSSASGAGLPSTRP